ncbi:anti-sigma factor antagonist [Thermophilibacter sp.]|uniref:anti-sigma factor antagonist n=1 Tax=Thermophilibacter sp. TaxID=2847309 RepID=UPI003A93B33C
MPSNANIALVPVEGDLDVTSAPAVRRRIDRLVSGGCRRVFVNMADVGFVDSAGLGLILTELRHLRHLGGLLSLVNVSDQVYLALRRMRVLDFMPVRRAGARACVTSLDPSVLPLWRMTFRVDDGSLSEARNRVGELLATLPFSADEVFDMKLACGEALGNAVDHTCEGGVLVTVTAYPDRALVEVSDCGGGFALADDEELPETGAFAERGRGIRLMRLLADSVSISLKQAGDGTVVRLVKLVRPEAQAAAQA